MNENIGKYLGTLMESRTQAHVFHLQTTSYAQHKALNKYYDGIVDLIDSYAEAYQGMYGTVYGYKMTTPLIEDPEKIKLYFDGLCRFISEMATKLPSDSYLKNIEDEIATLVRKTKYLLTLS